MLSHIEFYTFTIRYFMYLSTSQNEKSRIELKLGKELAHVLFHNSCPYLHEVLPCAFSVIWHFHCVCFYRTVFVCISQSHCLLLQLVPGRSGLIPQAYLNPGSAYGLKYGRCYIHTNALWSLEKIEITIMPVSSLSFLHHTAGAQT